MNRATSSICVDSGSDRGGDGGVRETPRAAAEACGVPELSREVREALAPSPGQRSINSGAGPQASVPQRERVGLSVDGINAGDASRRSTFGGAACVDLLTPVALYGGDGKRLAFRYGDQ